MKGVALAGFVCTVFGLLVARGVPDQDLGKEVGTTKHRLTLKELLRQGPQGPRNVVITEYRLCDNYVVERRQAGGGYVRAYIPIVPPDPDPPPWPGELRPEKVDLIVHCYQALTEDELIRRLGKTELSGLIRGTVADLGVEEQRLLLKSYPKTDPRTCLVLDEGSDVPPAEGVRFLKNAGYVLSAIGASLLLLAAYLRHRKRRKQATTWVPSVPPG